LRGRGMDQGAPLDDMGTFGASDAFFAVGVCVLLEHGTTASNVELQVSSPVMTFSLQISNTRY
jgi:hypothetical protein